MTVIYEPKGKAREYSPLALNVYKGCDHMCPYCYVKPMMKRFNSNYDQSSVQVRPNLIQNLKKQLKKDNIKEKVLLSFTTDPYCFANNEYNETRKVLEVLLKYQVYVSILTKGGLRILKDLDIIKKFKNIEIGTTLTFDNYKDSKLYEPGAALTEERIEMLRIMKENDIFTWASFEPVIYPNQSINLMKNTIEYVSFYKIGKWNHDEKAKSIDWKKFLNDAIEIMKKNKKKFYIKNDLRKYAEIQKS